MKKNLLKKSSLLLLISSLILAQPLVTFAEQPATAKTDEQKNTKDELNKYLRGLKYNKDLILTNNGEKLKNTFPTTGEHGYDGFTVVEKIKRSMSSQNENASILTSNEDRIFAGALLKADKGLLENNPTLISAERAPINLSISLPGMTNGSNVINVKNPTNSSVKSSVNNLLDRWNNSNNGYSIPAAIQYTEAMVKDEHQIKAQFGIDLEKMGTPLNINFDAIHKGEKQICIVKFSQVYFNVSVDAPSKPADFFANSVTKQDLIDSEVDEQTPPVYVSNVSYGRSMYIKLETSSKSTDVHAAFKALIKGVEIAPNSEYHRILQNTSVNAVILGGDSSASTKIVNGKVEDLKKIIQEGANYNKKNSAVPISYRTAFVKDNSPAVVKNNTEYIETKITSYKNGELVLKHTGAYVAKFFVEWEEVSYKDGKEQRVKKEWEHNGKARTAGFEETIPLKGNVRNLKVKVIENTGLAWESWRTVYNKENIELVKNRKIWIWGTTLNPKKSDIVTND